MKTETQFVSPKVEELARELEQYLETGRHLLVIGEGDCEAIAMCSCGHAIGNYGPDSSADGIVEAWQRHSMGLPR
jgi:acetone carboxylase gamma subunit